MNLNQFESIQEAIILRIKNMIEKKRNEYANLNDVLINFKRAASFLEQTPLQALFGMLTKHLISLRDIVIEQKTVPLELFQEKITDTINYLILLEGLFIENLNNKSKEVL